MTDRPTSPTAGSRTLRSDLARLRRRLVERMRPRGLLFSLRHRVATSTTGRRILLIALAAFLPVVIVAFVLAGTLNRTAQLTGEVQDEVSTRIEPVLVLSDELASAQVLIDRYFSTGAEHDRQALLSHAARVDAGFQTLRDAEQGSPAASRIVDSATGSWIFIRDTLGAPGFELPDGGARASLLATVSQTSAAIRQDLVRLTEETSARIVTLADDAQTTATWMRALVYGSVPLAALLGGVLVAWLLRDVRRGARDLLEAAQQLEQGQDGVRVPESTHGDLAPVARAFNAMAARIERQSRELQGVANRDELTGVMNRRGFDNVFHRELQRGDRYGHPTALLLCDIDHFKAVNDTFGHPAGDTTLRAVADAIGSAVRAVDRVGRWGGEEFAVLLPETDVTAAVRVAERINEVVRRQVVLAEGKKLAVTVSVGIAVHDPAVADRPGNPSAMVAHADAALYEAKAAGRDRVVLASA